MRVGIAYDLRSDYLREGYSMEETAELDQEDTIEALSAAIGVNGHDAVPIGNIRELARRLSAGERWDLVFNISEGVRGTARESQVPSLLEAFGIPYTMSDPLVLASTLHKGIAKLIVREAGVPTADFAVVETLSDAAAVDLAFPLFVKPACEGTGKGIDERSLVADRDALSARCASLLTEYRQPVLVETYLPGREFTVGVAGSGDSARVLGCMEVIFATEAAGTIYGYLNKQEYEGRMRYRPGSDDAAERSQEVALAAYRALGCRDISRVDIRFDGAGAACFVEVNPLPGLHPAHSDLPMLCAFQGMDYTSLIGTVIDEAMARIGIGAAP